LRARSSVAQDTATPKGRGGEVLLRRGGAAPAGLQAARREVSARPRRDSPRLPVRAGAPAARRGGGGGLPAAGRIRPRVRGSGGLAAPSSPGRGPAPPRPVPPPAYGPPPPPRGAAAGPGPRTPAAT